MAILVPLALVGLAVAIILVARVVTGVRRSDPEAAADERRNARILIHSINDDRCTGCDACVVVCPTNVLELVSNKSRVLRFGDCIQCEQCMWACPTQALVMHWEDSEAPPLKVPQLDPYYQTVIPGQYLIGEVAGKPLVKNAANAGRAVIEHMLQQGLRPMPRRHAEGSDPSLVDVVIVGSGPGGLSAALTCIHYGLSYVVLEKDQLIASTIARYPKGKQIMVEPYDSKNVSFLPVFDSAKEELLPLWHEMIERVGMLIHKGEAVESVRRTSRGGFDVRTTVGAYSAQRVVIATGTRGKPRTLGVPGENLPKVFTLLEDPANHRGQHVIVVGGGDSAIEAAIALADAGAKVTLSYRGRGFGRCQPKNKARINEYGLQSRVHILFGSNVTGFTADGVGLRLADGSEHRVKNEGAFVLIGADPPIAWLEKLGINYVERPHWYALGKTDQLVESLVGALPQSPRSPAELAALVLRQAVAPERPASERPPVPEPSVMVPLPKRPAERPALLPGMALDFGYGPGGTEGFLSSARRLSGGPGAPSRERPIDLEEFARKSRVGRPRGQTKRPRGADVTRLLRSLRDEGARLAHDESGVELISEVSIVSEQSSVPDLSDLSDLSDVSGLTGLRELPPQVAPPPKRTPAPVMIAAPAPAPAPMSARRSYAPEPLPDLHPARITSSIISSAPPPPRRPRGSDKDAAVQQPPEASARARASSPSMPIPRPTGSNRRTPSPQIHAPPNGAPAPDAKARLVPPPPSRSTGESRRPSFVDAPTRLSEGHATPNPLRKNGEPKRPSFVDAPTRLADRVVNVAEDLAGLESFEQVPQAPTQERPRPTQDPATGPTSLRRLGVPDLELLKNPPPFLGREEEDTRKTRLRAMQASIEEELAPWNAGEDYADAQTLDPIDLVELEPVAGAKTTIHHRDELHSLRDASRKKR